MLTRESLVVGALVALVAGTSVQARDTWRKTSYLTFSRPVALPGVTLSAGTYAFELADPLARLDIVRVWDRARSTVYYTAYTELVPKPAAWPVNRPIVLGESAPGAPPPILVWYPGGERLGHRFLYPAAGH